jgi:CRP/FNR family transcriptional regulator, cyclic AMP receptor protein
MASPIKRRYSRNSLTECLQECPLFRDLSPDSLKVLDNITNVISFAKGSNLFVQGQLSNGLFILRSGRVKLTSVTVGGSAELLAIRSGGEALGLSATVSGRPHVATATAMEITQVVLIRRNSFLQFIHTHGDGAVRVAQVLAELYDAAQEEKKYFLARQSAAQKLARFVLNWAVHEPEGDDRLQFDLTHEEIGHAIGTTRESVTRTLGKFKNQKILALHGSRLMIHDRSALRHIADA